VLRAANAILPHLQNQKGVKIRLSKRIPSGAGLGGGSSDAAATLIALNQLFDARLSRMQLAQIGSRLGSDVPFFCFGSSSFCQGRGDRVVPLPLDFYYPAVLFLPSIHLATPRVYHRFDEMNLGRTPLVAPEYANWAKMDAKSLMPLLVNDLEPAAFSLCPELGALRNSLEEMLGQKVRMSGSGSSLFTLCENLQQAEIFSVLAADKCGIKSLVAPVAKAV
jgi:4-diphosphocytidyl-2-C-methyl-D-erythritol kinase